jgi:thiol-disulfide isomerase/thioredoxin
MAAREYYSFKENNKFGIRPAYGRHQAEWQRVQDSLFTGLNLDNAEAVPSPSYQSFLGEFLLRTKEDLWTEAYEHPTDFYRTWYDTTPEAGIDLFRADQQNLLQEKIILHYFKSPAVVEYLYALLLEDALWSRNPTNFLPIYDRFKKRFPHSTYLQLLGPEAKTVTDRLQWGLNAKMVFAPDSGAHLHTWEDLLAFVKGKTVLVDMWGTWCSPCRQQIEENAKALHDYFKGKGVEFLYVANHDSLHTAQWKKLIAYFDLEGTHVLAGTDLTKDVMAKVKGTGFPTYVVIRRDGTFALADGGYPMKRDLVIKQLEAALQ